MLLLVIIISVLNIVVYVSVLHITADFKTQKSTFTDIPQNQGRVSLEIIKPPITAATLNQPKTVGD